MPVYKITFDLVDQDWGWTETYYADYTEQSAAMTSAYQILNFRRQLLGGFAGTDYPRIKTIRVSDVNRQRDALHEEVEIANGTKKDVEAADNPNLAVAVRCEAGASYNRTLFLSGQPDRICKSGKYATDTTWETAFEQFAQALVARPWGIYALDKSLPLLRVVAFTRPEENVVRLELAENHGLIVGDIISVKSIPGVTGVRGKQYVLTVPTLNSLTFVQANSGTWRGGGTIQKAAYALRRFTRLQVQGISRRPRGRPIDGPVGRRRARA